MFAYNCIVLERRGFDREFDAPFDEELSPYPRREPYRFSHFVSDYQHASDESARRAASAKTAAGREAGALDGARTLAE